MQSSPDGVCDAVADASCSPEEAEAPEAQFTGATMRAMPTDKERKWIQCHLDMFYAKTV